MARLLRRSVAKVKSKSFKAWLRLRAVTASLYCPVCDSRVPRFLPLSPYYAQQYERFGSPFRIEDAEMLNIDAHSCPFCNAADRSRLYALYLLEHLDAERLPAGCRILDFAPAPELSSFVRRRFVRPGSNVSYTTADLLMHGVDLKLDVTAMPTLDDASWDFVICSMVLEHVVDDRRALREIFRILKPGGQAIVTVPINSGCTEIDEDPTVTDVAERWRRFGQDDHVRRYSKQGFLARLREAEFIVRQLGQEHFGRETFARHAITPKSVLYVVEKPR